MTENSNHHKFKADDAARQERFSQFLDAVHPAREHFQESARQALMGSSVVMTAVAQLLDSYNNASLNHGASLVILLRSVVDIIVTEMPTVITQDTVTTDARLEALFNLRAVIQAELERRDASALDGLSALEGLLDGINNEIERIAVEETDPTTAETDSPTTYEVPIGA